MAVWLLLVCCCGCGQTKSQRATEQLLLSDAVDRSVASIDFRSLAGRKIYLDTTYVKFKGSSFVNADYIVSSIRQQLFAANCLVQDSKETAEFIVEPRIGALGTDSHNVTYGLPASNALSTAAAMLPNSPPIPAIPEISIAKRDKQMAAVKIAVFAYHRESRQPAWQSGLAQARSSSNDIWVFGAGPFQNGSMYDRARFAGTELKLPLSDKDQDDPHASVPVAYDEEIRFVSPEKKKPGEPGTFNKDSARRAKTKKK